MPSGNALSHRAADCPFRGMSDAAAVRKAQAALAASRTSVGGSGQEPGVTTTNSNCSPPLHRELQGRSGKRNRCSESVATATGAVSTRATGQSPVASQPVASAAAAPAASGATFVTTRATASSTAAATGAAASSTAATTGAAPSSAAAATGPIGPDDVSKPSAQHRPRRASAGFSKVAVEFYDDSRLDMYEELNLQSGVPMVQTPPSPPMEVGSDDDDDTPVESSGAQQDPVVLEYRTIWGQRVPVCRTSLELLTNPYESANTSSCMLNDVVVDVCMDVLQREHLTRYLKNSRHHKVLAFNSYFIGKLLNW